MLKGYSVIADIGCDHGILSTFLAQNGAKWVYACDISESSLKKARERAEQLKIKNISFCVSDGFKSLDAKIDAAVISGIGGEVISKIISFGAPDVLVLQPMKDTDILFETLYTSGYEVKKEEIVFDGGRYYEVILAQKGAPERFDFEVPPKNALVFNKAAFEFYVNRKKVVGRALEGARKALGADGMARCEKFRKKYESINGILDEFKCKGYTETYRENG